MNKGHFGIAIAILFVILGIYLTSVDFNNPDGSLSWKNYAGIACIVFFGALAGIGILRLVFPRKKTR